MKKFEELSMEEKKVLQVEFKLSDFGKWLKLFNIYEWCATILFILAWFTDFFSNVNIFVSIIILCVFIGFGEVVSYKKKSLVKAYYELKNNK